MDAMHQADRHMDEWEESLASARPPDPLVSPSPHHPFFASARSLEELREAVRLLDLIYYHTRHAAHGIARHQMPLTPP